MKYLTRGRANASLSPHGGRGVAMGVPVQVLPPVITRTAAAVIGPYTAGLRLIDRFTAGAYASTAGTVVVTRTWRVNGAPAAGTAALAEGQVVTMEDSVTDTASTPARVFRYGPVTVAAAAQQLGWSFDGATVTSIPSGPRWAFDGSTVTDIPEIA